MVVTSYTFINNYDRKSIDVGTILLTANNNILDGVEVTAIKPSVRYEIDKKIVGRVYEHCTFTNCCWSIG